MWVFGATWDHPGGGCNKSGKGESGGAADWRMRRAHGQEKGARWLLQVVVTTFLLGHLGCARTLSPLGSTALANIFGLLFLRRDIS